jgi:hypothetical protein
MVNICKRVTCRDCINSEETEKNANTSSLGDNCFTNSYSANITGLEEDTGQHIHPHLATVTYLTECGGPTIILNRVGTPDTTEDLSGLADNMIVSKPVFGKHIKFDGRLLHAAPSDLLEEVDDEDVDEDEENDSVSGSSAGSEEESDHVKIDSGDEISESGSVENNGSESDETSSGEVYPKRVTFLVNIWLNHIPIQSKAFPEGRLKHMKSPLESPSLLPSGISEVGNGCDLTDKTSTPSTDSRLAFEESVSVETPSIPIASTVTTDTETNTASAIGQHSQDKIWKFSNGRIKYAINIPLPPAEQLNILLKKSDAFRLCYNTSGRSIKIDIIPSKTNKRKLMGDSKRTVKSVCRSRCYFTSNEKIEKQFLKRHSVIKNTTT